MGPFFCPRGIDFSLAYCLCCCDGNYVMLFMLTCLHSFFFPAFSDVVLVNRCWAFFVVSESVLGFGLAVSNEHL